MSTKRDESEKSTVMMVKMPTKQLFFVFYNNKLLIWQSFWLAETLLPLTSRLKMFALILSWSYNRGYSVSWVCMCVYMWHTCESSVLAGRLAHINMHAVVVSNDGVADVGAVDADTRMLFWWRKWWQSSILCWLLFPTVAAKPHLTCNTTQIKSLHFTWVQSA